MVVVDGRIDHAIGIANRLLGEAASNLEGSLRQEPSPYFIIARNLAGCQLAADRIDDALNTMKQVYCQLGPRHYMYRFWSLETADAMHALDRSKEAEKFGL